VALAFSGEDLFVADTQNRRIRKIDVNGTVTTVLGNGSKLLTGPDVTAADSRLQQVGGLAVSPAGLLHFVDHGHVFRLEADGRVTLVVGSYDLNAPDGENKPATTVKLAFSAGLAFDAAGNLFIAETAGLRIRKVTPAGIITTVAGTGIGPSFAKIVAGTAAGELDVLAAEATLIVPSGVVVDGAGNLYIAEAGTRGARDLASVVPTGSLDALPVLDGRLRVLGSDGHMKTLAGLGAPAAKGKVVNPTGIALDAQGRIVFADSGSGEVKILSK
jgi:sugar lactone lactonase YvrE